MKSAAPATRDQLQALARDLRCAVIELSHRKETPHLASQLSVIEILVSCYFDFLTIDPSTPHDPNRDRCILSKGHAAPALYVALAKRGFFPESELQSYACDGSSLGEQPIPQSMPGIEAATGSLGHGLSIGVGIAAAARIQKRSFQTVVVLSDGECNEGSVWEAAMFAAAQRLSSLTAIVDFNKWQATGRSDEVMALSPFVDKWRAFGWDAVEVDGHDLGALHNSLHAVRNDKPRAIIAHTVKGKGVSFMEDDNNWHYRIPTADEVLRAHKEIRG